jgi:hypothetical protein
VKDELKKLGKKDRILTIISHFRDKQGMQAESWERNGGLTPVPVWVVCWSGAGRIGELGGLTPVPIWVVCWSGAGLTGELGDLLGFEGNRKGGGWSAGPVPVV